MLNTRLSVVRDAVLLLLSRHENADEFPVGQEQVLAGVGMKKWQCEVCGFIYDEEAGLPDEGIAPGTRWEEIPGDWECPDCGSSKDEFSIVEV